MLSSINSERVVYSAGFTSCGQHLKEYFKDNTTEEEWTVNNILDILNIAKFSWFKTSECSFKDGEEILNTIKMNPNAFSGHYTSMLFGRTKEKSDHVAREIAYNIWNTLKIRPLKNFYLWTILGREKDIKIDLKDNKEVGTRVVLTCEHPVTLLLCWFAQKISRIVCNDELWDCKFNITGEFNSSKYKKLIDKESDYDYILEADWSYYDSNIDTNFLIVAGLLICSGIPRDQLHRNIRYYIISSIVTKYVAIPPGIVVELNRAQPSGHPFGTLTNCYVNLIYWSLIGYKIYGDNYAQMMDVEVYGDDTRAFFKDHPNLNKIDDYVKELGLKSDKLIGNFRSTSERCDREHQIDYLKRRFDENGIVWNHKKMFDKLFYQSKNRNINDQYSMVVTWFDSIPTDSDTLIIVKKFGKYLYDNYKDKLSYENIMTIRRISRFIIGEDSRSKTKFDFIAHENRNIKNYKINNNIENQTLIYREVDILNDNNRTLCYADNKLILSFMALSPTKFTDNSEYNSIMVGRDPPNFDRIGKIDERLFSFTTRKTNELISKMLSKSRKQKYT